MEQPFGVVLRILETRDFARAYKALKQAKKESDVPSTPMVQLVKSLKTDDWMTELERIVNYPT